MDSSLFLTMLATSSVDSLNPIGITQQFVLQGLVKKPRHIWYFILTTAVVNMIFGYMVYYGVISLIKPLVDSVMNELTFWLALGEIVLAVGLLVFAVFKIVKRKKNPKNAEKTEKEETKKPISITPLALIGFGVVSTVSELTSALPYFTFLAYLVNYTLPFYWITLILILYNMVYIAPFVLLFVIYLISKQKFDALYRFLKKWLTKLSNVLVPLFSILVAGFLTYHAISTLIV